MAHETNTREKRPSARKAIVFLIVMAIVVAGLAAFALSQRSTEGPQVIRTDPVPIQVRTQTVSLQDSFTLEEKFSGLVTARRTSALGFQTGGRIASIEADIGDTVETGQSLARLDTRSLEARLASAEAVVEEARASYRLARATVDRQQTLKNRGHVSQQAVDEVEAQAATAFSRIEAAKAQADTLRVEIDLARITAPFAGMVTSRMSDEGAIASPGTPILELVEIGALEARIGLPAELAASLKTGATYQLVSAQGDIDAVLRATTGVIGAGERTVTTLFDIEDAKQTPVGTVVRIGLSRDLGERGTWVPLASLTEASRGLWAVYVAEPEASGHVAEQRLVEIVHSENERAYVRGSLIAGDHVIVEGVQRIAPGQAVETSHGPVADVMNEG
ncbi:MAG: efflux RND transporter periplasmic adaptor subunit [Pseudomonadota bacterium]